MKLFVIFGACLGLVTAQAQQLQFDPSFPGGTGSSGTVFSVQVQPDDHVLLAGDFTTFNGQANRSVVRILPSGQRDTSFQTGTGADGRVNNLRLLPDGRVFLGGIFNNFNGAPSKNLVRLLPNGARDTAFNVGTGLNNEVLGMEGFADGSVLLGGFFGQYKGAPTTQPLKILPNGARDTTFNLGGTGTSGLIEVIRQQPDGKILVAGTITQYNGQAVGRGVIRLLPNGQRDTTFNTGTGLASGTFRAMALQGDGKIILAGNFSSFNGRAVQRLIRLHPTGVLDTTFLVSTPFTGTIVSILVRKNGNILAFGNYSAIVGQLPHAIAEFSSTGLLLTQPGICVEMNSVPQGSGELSDSSIVIAGGFTVAGGANRPRIGKLINVGGSSAAAPSLSASVLQLCQGASVNLFAAGILSAGRQWVWYAGGCGLNAVGFGSALLQTPQQTTTYFVRSEGACSSAGICDSITIVVGDTSPPVPLQANLPNIQAFCTVSLAPPTALSSCGVVLTGLSNGPTTFTSPGNYQVQWIFTDAFGNNSSQQQQVQVDSIDTGVSSISAGLQARDSTANAYQWLDCMLGMAPVAGATASLYPNPGAGQWAVAITRGQCTDTSACLVVTGSSVEVSAWQTLKLYPNPSREAVTLDFAFPLQLQLHDLQGRLVFEQQSAGGKQNLLLPALKPGVYVWTFTYNNQRKHQRQLIY